MNSLNRKLMRDLWHLRGQVLATALVVACGVATFVAMRTTYSALSATLDEYYSNYRFGDVFVNLKRAPESVAAQLRQIRGVSAVQTRVTAQVTIDLPDLIEPAQGRLVSIPERQTAMLNDLHLIGGRYIEAEKTDEVIISGAFAEANDFQPGDSLTAILNGRYRKLTIVGIALSPEYVYEIRPGDIFPDNRRFGVLWMNRRTVAAAFQMEGAFNDAVLTLAPEASEAEVIEQVDRILEPFGASGAYGRGEQPSNLFINNELGELQVFGTVIPAIFLGVTAFLLHLVLSRLVATEREQIGLLKAFGYSSLDVGLHYLKFAVTAIFGGIVAGIFLGLWIGSGMANLYAEYFHFPVLRYETKPLILLWAFLLSLGAASVGAISAVRRAVGLPPAEAMRPEPPARFHAGFMENWRLLKLVSPEVRIIIRNLARQPVKALLSAFGISLSVALLFVGFYFYDAIFRIIEVQFYHVVRDDIEVAFNKSVSESARYELEAMPGVFRVETYLAVPARLRFGHRSRRVGIVGVETGGELRRVVDRNFRVANLPPEGIVLNKALADILQVSEGDNLTVEIKAGARPVREIKVVKTVDELVGLSAYMEIGAFNRLLREEATITGAYMSVDERETPRVLAKLKQMPAVESVGLPQAALDSFNATIARTIGTSTSFLIAFACVIAFGVVYNGARIALSERGRELASLRVLGFTQREISVMLLGEQAILTLIAVPLGYFVGLILILLIINAINVEIIRLPFVLSAKSFVYAFLIVAGAALLSGLLVAWRLRSLDLIEVLKTRE
jgi:putative ABC transport system permease protein